MMRLNNWNELLAQTAEGDKIIARAPDDDEVWGRRFDNGYGLSEGDPVLAWSEKFVYFPVVYDGAEWIERAPRNPQPEGQRHVGGE